MAHGAGASHGPRRTANIVHHTESNGSQPSGLTPLQDCFLQGTLSVATYGSPHHIACALCGANCSHLLQSLDGTGTGEATTAARTAVIHSVCVCVCVSGDAAARQREGQRRDRAVVMCTQHLDKRRANARTPTTAIRRCSGVGSHSVCCGYGSDRYAASRTSWHRPLQCHRITAVLWLRR